MLRVHLFRTTLAASCSLSGCSIPDTRQDDEQLGIPHPRFDYGVASGDPLADRVVLWTHARYPGSDDEVPLRWEVAEDARFRRIVASGIAVASADHNHTVHVSRGLEALADGELALDPLRQQPRGTLRVAAPLSVTLSRLSARVPDFLARHPSLRLELDLDDRRVDLIREGFDLALRGSDRLEDSSLVARKAGGSAACAVCVARLSATTWHADHACRAERPQSDPLQPVGACRYLGLSSGR